MSDEALSAIVEEIGVLADRAEASKWGLAEAVATAYAEFSAYHRGLTAGLCSRLRKSTDLIYSLRDAWELKNLLVNSDFASDLSVSHFVTLSHLRDRYDLSDDSCREWLEWAQDNEISVRELSTEINARYEEDARKSFFKRIDKISKLVELVWTECETIGMPDTLRVLTKNALRVLREWIAAVVEWGANEQKSYHGQGEAPK